MELAIVLLLTAVLGLLAFQYFRRPTPPAGNDGALVMQQQIDALRSETAQHLTSLSDAVGRGMKDTSELLFQSLRSTTDQINQQMSGMTQTVQKTTEQLNQQMSAQTDTIGSRLDNAAKVIGDLQKSQGQILKAGDEIRSLGQNMTKLEELLRAPKMRGGLGELLLEDVLKQVLPSNTYAMQYRFRSGNAVDAVIKTANGMIPVDSKFPLENFRKLIETQSDTDKKTHYKLFVNDVKKHIDAIAQKYILPDEGTFEFALMYIPAENIYYETIIKNELYGEENNLYNYAVSKRVFSVSPNTFYAQLQVIALGFKGMEVEKSAKEIIQNLSRLKGELEKFREEFDLVGRHVNNAANKYGEAVRRLEKFEEKLIQSSSGAEESGVQGTLLP
ncbi:MAG: DNA recombination protein RmuC [Ignavibacteriales bacterium]|nr:DNA recombination protein RmuC [Ignavibacteriales bacterium]